MVSNIKMISVVNKSDLVPFLSDFLNIDVEGHILIEIDSTVYESPLELSDNDFFLIKRILGLPPANHAMVEDLDQIKKISIEAIWYLFLKYKGFRKADLRSPATIRVQENEKS